MDNFSFFGLAACPAGWAIEVRFDAEGNRFVGTIRDDRGEDRGELLAGVGCQLVIH